MNWRNLCEMKRGGYWERKDVAVIRSSSRRRRSRHDRSEAWRIRQGNGASLDTTLFGINQCGQLTVQVPFEASSVLRSPGPFASLAASTWSLTDLVYSARSMLRNTPNGVGE